MKLFNLFCFLTIFYFLSGCVSDKNQSNEIVSKIKISQGSSLSKAGSLFDNDPSTGWETQFETNINEWISLDFEKPVFIQKLDIKSVRKADFVLPSRYLISINDSRKLMFSNSETIELNMDVFQLDIRVIETEKDEYFQFIDNEKYYDLKKNIALFKSGISELKFWNKDNLLIKFSFKDSSYKPTEIKNSEVRKKDFTHRWIKNRVESQKQQLENSIFFNENGNFQLFSVTLEKNNIKKMVDISGTWTESTKSGKPILLNGILSEYRLIDDSIVKKKYRFEDVLKFTDVQIEGTYVFDKLFYSIPPEAFVDIQSLDSTITEDIRYATENNFTKQKLYECPKCYLRYAAALALAEANKLLLKKNYIIKVFDCYRPLEIQKKLWDIMPNVNYVANPDKGSAHNRGASVDLTIVDKATGKELDMGTAYDFFGIEAYPGNKDFPEAILKNRSILFQTMEKSGFIPVKTEWWHYTLRSVSKLPLENFKWKCK